MMQFTEKIRTAASAFTATQWLFALLFCGVLVFRFAWPVYDSPFFHIYSDPLRHWTNATHLRDITIFGGIDPKGYQFFLGGLYQVFKGWPDGITFSIGILCAATAYVWYRVARELLPDMWARGAGLIIGVMPSLLVIFSFFMTETLLLFLFGLAMWLSFVCWRKPSVIAFLCVLVVWEWAALTRIIVAPVGVLVIVWLLWEKIADKRSAIVLGIAVSAVLFYPFAKFTQDRIHVFTPFSYGALNKIYALSGHSKIEMTIDNEWWWFQSPAYTSQPLFPLSDYHLAGSDVPYKFTIKTAQGRVMWRQQIVDLKKNVAPSGYIHRIGDNIVYAAFDASWPDSWNAQDQSAWVRAGYYMRWIWAPLMLIVLVGGWRGRYTRPQVIFILATMGMIASLFLQNAGIMEGRYRKPVEPLLIISTMIILCTHIRRAAMDGVSLLHYYHEARNRLNLYLKDDG